MGGRLAGRVRGDLLTQAVQDWVDGRQNYGVLIKQQAENINNVLSFGSKFDVAGNYPWMVVTYEPGGAEADEPPQQDSTEAPFFSSSPPVEPADPDPVDSDDPDSPNEGSLGFRPAGELAVDGVTFRQNADLIKFRNADGVWWIYKRCFDRTAGDFRYNVGPGYIARLRRGEPPNTVSYVDDFRGRRDTGRPGYMNAVNGGLGTFGWHHARGPVNATPAGDDPTTTDTREQARGRPSPGFAIEGRMCANSNANYGVHGRSFAGPNRVSSTRVDFTVDIFFRDARGNTGYGINSHSLSRVRYRYTFLRSSVRVWISVLLYPRTNVGGVPFVKEPKFSALIRGGGYTRMATFRGETGEELFTGVMEGIPDCTLQPTCVLPTEQTGDPGRKRVRWDYGNLDEQTREPVGDPGCSTANPCFNAVMRSYRTPANGNILRNQSASPWEGARRGLDGWAIESSSESRGRAYPRDTDGDVQVTSCKVPGPIPDYNQNGDTTDDDYDESVHSQNASPKDQNVRNWEHGGWKDPDPNSQPFRNQNPYQAAMTLFNGWEGGRGPFDCEPLQRAFPSSQEAWGTFASFSLNDGWVVSP